MVGSGEREGGEGAELKANQSQSMFSLKFIADNKISRR